MIILIQIRSCGVLTRHKKVQITTTKVGSEGPTKVTCEQAISLKRINNENVTSTAQWVDNVQYTYKR